MAIEYIRNDYAELYLKDIKKILDENKDKTDVLDTKAMKETLDKIANQIDDFYSIKKN